MARAAVLVDMRHERRIAIRSAAESTQRSSTMASIARRPSGFARSDILAINGRMRAVVVERWMEPGDLRTTDVGEPAVGPGMLGIDVKAAGCNFFDILM